MPRLPKAVQQQAARRRGKEEEEEEKKEEADAGLAARENPGKSPGKRKTQADPAPQQSEAAPQRPAKKVKPITAFFSSQKLDAAREKPAAKTKKDVVPKATAAAAAAAPAASEEVVCLEDQDGDLVMNDRVGDRKAKDDDRSSGRSSRGDDESDGSSVASAGDAVAPSGPGTVSKRRKVFVDKDDEESADDNSEQGSDDKQSGNRSPENDSNYNASEDRDEEDQDEDDENEDANDEDGDDNDNDDDDEDDDEEEEVEVEVIEVNGDETKKNPTRKADLLAPGVKGTVKSVRKLAGRIYASIPAGKLKRDIIIAARKPCRMSLKDISTQLSFMADFERKENDSAKRWWLKDDFKHLVTPAALRKTDEAMKTHFDELAAQKAAKAAGKRARRASETGETASSPKAKRAKAASTDGGTDGAKAPQQEKREVPPELTEKDDPRIGAQQTHLETWLADARTLLSQGCVLKADLPACPSSIPDDFASEATQGFLAGHMQGRCEPLDELSEKIASVLGRKSTPELHEQMLLLAERKAYGIKEKAVVAKSDTCADALWRWEVATQNLLPENSLKPVLENRRQLNSLRKRISAAQKVLKTLKANHGQKKETRAARELEVVEKYLREDAVQLQRERERQEKAAAREQERERREQEKEEKRRAHEKEREEQRRIREKEKEDQRRAREEAKAQEAAKKQLKKGVPLTNFFSVKAPPSSPAVTGPRRASAMAPSPALALSSLAEDESARNKRAKVAADIDRALEENAPLDLGDWVKHLRASRPRHKPKGGKASRAAAGPKSDEKAVAAAAADEDPVSLANKCRKKLYHFGENRRPPYFGTFRKRSTRVTGRRPFAQDASLDYEVDSDLDWQEDPDDAESLGASDAASEDDKELDYQDGWLLRDDEVEYNSDAMNEDEAEADDEAAADSNHPARTKEVSRRYAVGIVYDRARIEAQGDHTDASDDDATNLRTYPVVALPPAGVSTHEQANLYFQEPVSLEPPSEAEIALELLTKADRKKLGAQEKALKDEAKTKEVQRAKASKSTVAGNDSAQTTKTTVSAEAFPARFKALLVSNVHGSDLRLMDLSKLVFEEIDKVLMKAYVEKDFKGDKGAPPKITCIRAAIRDIASKPRKNAAWTVPEEIRQKFVSKPL